MSESLITDWSGAFCYWKTGTRSPLPGGGRKGPPCTAGLSGCLVTWVAMEVTAAWPAWAGDGPGST